MVDERNNIEAQCMLRMSPYPCLTCWAMIGELWPGIEI